MFTTNSNFQKLCPTAHNWFSILLTQGASFPVSTNRYDLLYHVACMGGGRNDFKDLAEKILKNGYLGDIVQLGG